jgi:hypothetical protein
MSAIGTGENTDQMSWLGAETVMGQFEFFARQGAINSAKPQCDG